MLKFLRLTAVCLLAAVLHSCCTEMYCEGIEDLRLVNFDDFSIAELDSVVLYTYADLNHSNLVDSSFLFVEMNNSGQLYANIYPNLQIKASYTFKLPNNTEYKLGGFGIKRSRCNSGFLCRDFFLQLDSYIVNGQRQSGPFITITK